MAAREALVEAAFTLFDEQGYAATTVEQIVERAGVSRSTFFRAFRSKEDVIFPRHDEVQARIAARLATVTPQTYRVALREAAGLVLAHYLDEGPLALSRYRLTRTVPALRDREIASMLGYQRIFREHVRGWLTELDVPDVDLHAELVAAAIVTAHNVVLRRWLREETDEPWRELDDAMDGALATLSSVTTTEATPAASTTVVVVPGDGSVDDVLASVRQALTRITPRS